MARWNKFYCDTCRPPWVIQIVVILCRPCERERERVAPPLSYWGPYILSSTTQNIITHQRRRREENAARGLQYTHGRNVNWTAAIQSCSQGKNRKKKDEKKRVSVSRELFNGKKCHIKYLGFVCSLLLLFIYKRKEEKRFFFSLFGCGHIFDQSAVSAELRV